MPTYSYNALDQNGCSVDGTLESPNESQAINELRQMQLYPCRVSLFDPNAPPKTPKKYDTSGSELDWDKLVDIAAGIGIIAFFLGSAGFTILSIFRFLLGI